MAIKTFTAGSVLTASDTNTYLANAGLVYIDSVTTTGANVNFYSKLSSTYRNYKIIVTTTANTTSVDCSMQLANGTTPVGGTNYSSSGYRIDYAAAGGVTAQNDLGVAQFIVGRLDSGGAFGTMNIDLFNPFATSVTTLQSQFIDARFAGNRGGRLNTTTSYDGFTLSLSATWAGTVSLYGYRIP